MCPVCVMTTLRLVVASVTSTAGVTALVVRSVRVNSRRFRSKVQLKQRR